MKIRFLLDENLPPRIEDALRDLDAEMDVTRVGDPAAPALGTLDPDILTYLESSQRLLVTGNRRSMPKHLAAHLAAGRHHFGIVWVRRGPAFLHWWRRFTWSGLPLKPKSGSIAPTGCRIEPITVRALGTTGVEYNVAAVAGG